jgi:hypothetical protein
MILVHDFSRDAKPQLIHAGIKKMGNIYLKPNEYCIGILKMQLVGVILLLISIGTTVGPIGTVVVMNSNDLTQIVIPPEIKGILDGESSLIAESEEGDFNIGLMVPKFVSSTFDITANTYSVTVNVTNILNYDLTLNSLDATVTATKDNAELATIHLSNPIAIPAGDWSMVTVSGTWTQAAEDYYLNNPDASSINVTLANAKIDVNGVVVQISEPIEIGEIPLTLK